MRRGGRTKCTGVASAPRRLWREPPSRQDELSPQDSQRGEAARGERLQMPNGSGIVGASGLLQ